MMRLFLLFLLAPQQFPLSSIQWSYQNKLVDLTCWGLGWWSAVCRLGWGSRFGRGRFGGCRLGRSTRLGRNGSPGFIKEGHHLVLGRGLQKQR